MKPPSFFDLILQNSKFKQPEPAVQKEIKTPTATPPLYNLLTFMTFFLFAFILYMAAKVISIKFSFPLFSYFDILKFYAAAAVLKRLIK